MKDLIREQDRRLRFQNLDVGGRTTLEDRVKDQPMLLSQPHQSLQMRILGINNRTAMRGSQGAQAQAPALA